MESSSAVTELPAGSADAFGPVDRALISPDVAVDQVRETLAKSLFPFQRQGRPNASGAASAVSPRTPKSDDVSGLSYPPLGSGEADDETLQLLLSRFEQHLNELATGTAPLRELLSPPYRLVRDRTWFMYVREERNLDQKLHEYLSPALEDCMTSVRTKEDEIWSFDHDLSYLSAEGVRTRTVQGDGALFPLGASYRGAWWEIKAATDEELRAVRAKLVAQAAAPVFAVREVVKEQGGSEKKSVVQVLGTDGSYRMPTKDEKILLQVIPFGLVSQPCIADAAVTCATDPRHLGLEEGPSRSERRVDALHPARRCWRVLLLLRLGFLRPTRSARVAAPQSPR